MKNGFWILVVLAVLTVAGNDFASSQGSSWKQVDNVALPAGISHSPLAYDWNANRLLLYGGSGGPGAHLERTWECKGGVWKDLNPAKPAAMGTIYDHGAAYDPCNKEFLVFGGDNNGNYSDVMWVFSGNTWSMPVVQVLPPSARLSPVLGVRIAYHPPTQRVIAFGGNRSQGGHNFSNETWEWDGATRTWTLLNPSNRPDGRWSHTMCYDPSRGAIVLYGGWNNINGYLDDCWEWSGNDWTQVNKVAPWPGPRFQVGLSYDFVQKRMLLFGGCDRTSVYNALWERSGTGSWVKITASGPRAPQARRDPLFCFDPTLKSTIMFGGQPAVGGAPSLADCWLLTAFGGIWNDLGGGSACFGNITPVASGSGGFMGTMAKLSIVKAPPQAWTILAFNLKSTQMPFAGGNWQILPFAKWGEGFSPGA